MQVVKIFDRKPVHFLSSKFTEKMVLIGKTHWKMKEPTHKPEMIMYNKYRVGWIE